MNRKDDTVLLSEEQGERRTGDLSPSGAAASHPSTGAEAPHTIQNIDPHPSPDDTVLLNDHGSRDSNDETGPVDETTLLSARDVTDLSREGLPNTEHHTDPIPDSRSQHQGAYPLPSHSSEMQAGQRTGQNSGHGIGQSGQGAYTGAHQATAGAPTPSVGSRVSSAPGAAIPSTPARKRSSPRSLIEWGPLIIAVLSVLILLGYIYVEKL
jgi:hypothetical protein